MATIYPDKPEFKTSGEKLIFTELLLKLPDHWNVFYEPFINGRRPDFILFSPDYGLTILEVKDYTITTIRSLTPLKWKINVGNITKTIKSPMQQVTDYRNEIYNLLSKNEKLRAKEGNYKGQLKFPVSVLCCFPYLSTSEIQVLKLSRFFPNDLIISKEDSTILELFLQKLFRSSKRIFAPKPLTEEESICVIQSIYPQIQVADEIPKSQKLPFTTNSKSLSIEQFDNYVDELLYVSDCIAHYYNFERKSLEEIIVVYNQKRAALPNSKKYLDFLIGLLRNKNIPFCFEPSKEKILFISYELLKRKNFTGHIIFMIDFNLLFQNVLKANVLPLIKNNNQNTIIITSNGLVRSLKKD